MNGTNGVDGAQGATGAIGPIGATGSVGPQGAQGAAGLNGVDGVQGPQGLQGTAGLNGTNGVDGAAGAQGAQGAQGTTGANGINGLPAAKYVVSNDPSDPGTHTTINAAIAQALLDGQGPSNPTTILVRAGTYNESVVLEPGIHIVSSNTGKNFGTQINGNMTFSPTVSGNVTLVGLEVFASSGDALAFAGTASGSQIYMVDCGLQASAGDAAEVNATLGGPTPGIIADNSVFRGGAGGFAINMQSGTFQGRGNTINAQNNASVSLNLGANGRAWTRDTDFNGRVVVGNTTASPSTVSAVFEARHSQFRTNNTTNVVDNTAGRILITDSILGAIAPAEVYSGDAFENNSSGAVWYGGLNIAAGNTLTIPFGSTNIGTAGPAGPQGASGTNGVDGAQGAAGPQGSQGATGAAGPQGDQGIQGIQGNQGIPGAIGATGGTGPQGAGGPQGAAGPQGATGTNGAQGPQGAQGATGASPWGLNGNDTFYTAGKVGIGTSTPLSSTLLHIRQTLDPSIQSTVFIEKTISGGVAALDVSALGRAINASVTGTASDGVTGNQQNSSAVSGTAGVKGNTQSQVGGAGVAGLALSSSGTGNGVFGQSNSASGLGVSGLNLAGGTGVYGQGFIGVSGVGATNGDGVRGSGDGPSGTGVRGTSNSGVGVSGSVSQNSGIGVRGANTGSSGFGRGVLGTVTSTGGAGVMGTTFAASALFTSFPGPSAPPSATTTTAGVVGVATGTNTAGVYGFAGSMGTGAIGIDASATGSGSAGVRGITSNASGVGVYGISDAFGDGATAVRGEVTATTSGGAPPYTTQVHTGVLGRVGLNSQATNSAGVWGDSTATAGSTVGVRGTSASNGGTGVRGENSNTTGGVGVTASTAAASGRSIVAFGSIYVDNRNTATLNGDALTIDLRNSRTARLDADGVWQAHGFNNISDRTKKQNFTPISPIETLDKVVNLPITRWNYIGDDQNKQHVGPMAQDFHAAFGLNGSDDKVISTLDGQGVALAAIQGLNIKLGDELKQRDLVIEAQQARIAEMESRVVRLEQIATQSGFNLKQGAGFGALFGLPLIGIALLRRRKGQ